MSNQINKAARRTLALTFRDGLVDMLLGSFFVLLAIQEPLEKSGNAVWVSYLPALLTMAIGVPIYAYLKKKVVTPRIGVAKVSIRRNSSRRSLLLVVIALQLVTLVILILGGSGWLGENLPGQAGWVIDAFFGFAIFGFFVFLGYSAEVPRFYLYGLLLASDAFSRPFWHPENVWVGSLPVLIAGFVMVGGGVFAMFTFLREYPPVDMEAANG